MFLCGWDHNLVSAKERCPLIYGGQQRLYVVGTTSECQLRERCPLMGVKNAVFVCNWYHVLVSV